MSTLDKCIFNITHMLLWSHEEDIKQTNKQKILFLQVELFFSFNNEYYTDLKKEANINGESVSPRKT